MEEEGHKALAEAVKDVIEEYFAVTGRNRENEEYVPHKKYVLITFATLIVAAVVFFFLIPSQVSVGGAYPALQVLANVIPLNISVITFLLNALLLVVGFLLIGSEFGIKTVYTSLLLPLFLGIFEVVFPDFTSINGDPMLDTVCYIFVVSIGLAMLFKQNASSGGLDIVAKLLNKYFHMELGKAMALQECAWRCRPPCSMIKK